VDLAAHLLRSPDADERLRGLERAAVTRTPEALALLLRAAGPGLAGTPVEGLVRSDSRALLVVVRALATWMEKEPARAMLARLLEESTTSLAPNPGALAAAPAAPRPRGTPSAEPAAGRDPAAEAADALGRVERAREEAAMALASWGDEASIESLVTSARKNGPWQSPIVEALVAHPPPSPVLSGVTLTTPATLALAVQSGDLRSLGTILGGVRASDPLLRAASIAALGLAGDARVLDAAREAAKDKDPRVRVAGADALVHLGATDAAQAVEALVGDDATARDGLRLAQLAQGEGITKAAAARAVASSDAELRSLAVAALGRQTSAAAVTALVALAGDPRLAGDAVDALARSAAAGAMAALEAMMAGPTRRLAARAYLVRRVARGERTARGDGLLRALATMPGRQDALDRSVGVEALIALGELPLERGLADEDPRVRRAAAMAAGALADRDRASAALLSRLAIEKDETTRVVLAAGLRDGDPAGAVPTVTLVERAQAGGPDAPLAALALARRADDELSPKVNALLASHDPLLRAHAARGLAASTMRDVVGRLGGAYEFEPSRRVRRALVEALARRTGEDAGAPSRQRALELAASMEADAVTRAQARRALEGKRPAAAPSGREIAWLRIVPAEGAPLPHELTASVTGDDGVVRPIVFDEDGYALVPGMPPGDADLRLAPRLPSFDAR
jgi:HEAT repeat protein